MVVTLSVLPEPTPKYRMLYINMGHGDKIFTSPIQDRLIENGLLWLLGKGGG